MSEALVQPAVAAPQGISDLSNSLTEVCEHQSTITCRLKLVKYSPHFTFLFFTLLLALFLLGPALYHRTAPSSFELNAFVLTTGLVGLVFLIILFSEENWRGGQRVQIDYATMRVTINRRAPIPVVPNDAYLYVSRAGKFSTERNVFGVYFVETADAKLSLSFRGLQPDESEQRVHLIYRSPGPKLARQFAHDVSKRLNIELRRIGLFCHNF